MDEGVRVKFKMPVFIIATLGILLFGILTSNLKFKFSLIKYDKDDSIVVSLTSLYGIFRHTKTIPVVDLIRGDKDISILDAVSGTTDKRDKSLEHDNPAYNMFDTKKIATNYKKIYTKYEHYIKERLIFNNIYWHTRVGTNDAAETAVLVGAIWAIKASIVSFIIKRYNFPEISINVVPDYNISVFETSIDCIFSIKLGNIINANIKALLAQIRDGVKNE